MTVTHMHPHQQRGEDLTLAADLEARRLEHRSRRMGFVIEALRERARGYEQRGTVPAPLQAAVAEFSLRLHEDRARLAELRRSRATGS